MKNYHYKILAFTITTLPLILGVFLINLSFSLDKNIKHLKEVAIYTKGTVVFGATNKDSSSKVQYEVNGKIYSIYASIGRTDEGVTTSVYYDPKEPSNAMVNLDYYNKTRLIGILLVGILLSIVGLYGMYKTTIGSTLKRSKKQLTSARHT